jgi:glycosyltransferase involved in cell wall biosynthesis
MRVCLVSPRHLSTNPRLVKEARALRSAGHAVHIVHGRFTRWGADNDQLMAGDHGSLTAIRFGPTEASKADYFRQSLVRRSAHALLHAGVKTLGLIEAAHAPAMRELAIRTSDIEADLYIAHYVAALPAAARAAAKHHAVYAFDAEDFHLGDLPDVHRHAREKSIIRAIEGRYLPGAAYVTAASPLIAEAYSQTYRIPAPVVLLNCFPRKNAPPASSPRGEATPGPSLYWFSQTIGAGRGLECAIEAIARASSKPHLYLRGAFADGYESTIRSKARSAGVTDRLHVLEPAHPDHLEQLGAQYDLGYVSELAETHNRQIALTNKLFSYLISGIPAVASDIRSHRLLAPQLGPAIELFGANDSRSLASILDGFLENPVRLAAARNHAWKLGQDCYNWETERDRFLGLIDSIAASRPMTDRVAAP